MFHALRADRVRIAALAAATAIAMAGAPGAGLAQSGSGAPAVQSSVAGGVTVKVTPMAFGPAGSRWEFGVVLDTHSADLSDDLVRSTTLSTGDGRTLEPVSWTGAPPGGHHREGVLAFDVTAPRPASIELRIVRPGESEPRIFRWQL